MCMVTTQSVTATLLFDFWLKEKHLQTSFEADGSTTQKLSMCYWQPFYRNSLQLWLKVFIVWNLKYPPSSRIRYSTKTEHWCHEMYRFKHQHTNNILLISWTKMTDWTTNDHFNPKSHKHPSELFVDGNGDWNGTRMVKSKPTVVLIQTWAMWYIMSYKTWFCLLVCLIKSNDPQLIWPLIPLIHVVHSKPISKVQNPLFGAGINPPLTCELPEWAAA